MTLLGAVTLYLHFNGDAMFHHILGGVAASEGIYLIIYHMFLDRMVSILFEVVIITYGRVQAAKNIMLIKGK